jgi:hypothetical protein
MLKVALLATAVALAASAATAGDTVADDTVPPTAVIAPCHPGHALPLACPMRESDAEASPSDLARLAASADTPFAWTPPGSDDLAFKDAATATVGVLPVSVDHDRTQRLAPALLALGALVLLLRKRPH